MLINSVSLAILIISVFNISRIIQLWRKYSIIVFIIIASGIYLIAKYSTANKNIQLLWCDYLYHYFVLIYSYFWEAFFHQIFGDFIEELGDLFEGGTY